MEAVPPGKRHKFTAECGVYRRKCVTLRMVRIYNTFSNMVIGIICTIIFGSCGNKSQSTDISTTAKIDNDTLTIEQVTASDISNRIIEDTIIGNWSIKTTIAANNVIVVSDNSADNDSSVYLTLAYQDKVLFENKEIRTGDIVELEGVYKMQWGGNIDFVSENAVYLSFGCFLPDTDDGWQMLYKINKNGNTDLIVLDYEMGLEGYPTVSEFFAYYFSERRDGVKISDLKPLFERFCTDEICEKLLNKEIAIESNDTNLSNALKTFVIKLGEEDSYYSDMNELYPYSVEYKPNPNDENITDVIRITVREKDSKIAELNSGERIII